MKVKVTVKSNRLPEIKRRIHTRVSRIVAQTAVGLEADMKSSMTGDGPSLPGETPAVDTGALMNSIQADRVTATHWRVTVGEEYGEYLEYGTVFMEPRPFVEPAVERAVPEFYARLRAMGAGL